MESVIVPIAIYGVLVPVGIGLWRYTYLEQEARLLFYMLVPVAANQFFSEWWVYNVEPNNLPFFHLYMAIEFVMLSLIFRSYLRSYSGRIVELTAAVSIVIYLIYFAANPEQLWQYSTYARAIEAVIILVFAGLYFIMVYQKQEHIYLQKTSGFWIVGGLILYFSSNLLIFVFSDLVFRQESSAFSTIWVLHDLLTILLYIAYTIGLLCKKPEVTS